jgi:hypothetical protein
VGEEKMKVDNYVLLVAGFFISSSVLLGIFYNENWLFFTLFVGLNLFQYSLSGFCPLKIMLEKAGVGS